MGVLGYRQFRELVLERDAGADALRAIVSRSYPQFVAALRSRLGDGKVMAALTAGREDGRPEDELVEVPRRPVSLVASDLRPTQREIDLDKSLAYQLGAPRGGARTLEIIMGPPSVEINGPILTLNGEWVIDGHHRWSQVYCMNPSSLVTAWDLRTRDGVDPVEFLKAVQMAIASVTRRLDQQFVKGRNLLTVGKQDLIDYVLTGRGADSQSHFAGITDAAAEILLPGGTREAAAEVVWANVQRMQRQSRPPSGAPSRGDMPQTDDVLGTPAFKDALGTGAINYKEPFSDGE